MAEKAKMHSAGIFADMTVDGPEIGTLVIIVDRAKNLPNRKSIGKQDPYCAARLGKEAKKTATDRRGGQTPKWDQELRFTVHDSPDYYQLKVSVFNDDKKTDLIGEAWVNLQEVLVPGGGQNDLWHNLNCRGKYAGEIRIEITYYDTRPKQEKPRDRIRDGGSNAVEGGRDSLGGPRGPKDKPKRRPLPSDPTGVTPSPVETPERMLPQTSRGFKNGTPDHQPQQSRGQPTAAVPEYAQNQQPQPYNTPEHVQPLQQRPYATPEHIQVQQPRAPYNTPPTYIQAQSPLQNLEYNTPSHSRTQSHQVQGRYGPSGLDQSSLPTDYNTPPPHVLQQPHIKHASPGINGYSQSSTVTPDRQHLRDMYSERLDDYGQTREESYTGSNVSSRYEQHYTHSRGDLRQEYAPQQVTYEPPPSEYGQPSSPEGPPPPPPVHRVNQPTIAPASSPGYGLPPPNPTREAQFDHLREDNHRHSMPAYSQVVPHQPYTPPRQQHALVPVSTQQPYGQEDNYQGSFPRHNSYDDRYNSSFNSMQPTVEDAPPSPTSISPDLHRASEPRMSQYGDRRYNDVPSPAPLNLSGRGSAASANSKMNANPYSSNAPHTVADSRHADSFDQPSPMSKEPEPHSYNQDPIEPQQNSFMPHLPPTLVAGMDPYIAREISDRIYSDTRASRENYAQVQSESTQYPGSSQEYHPAQPQYRDDVRSEHYNGSAPGFPPQAATSDRLSRGISSTNMSIIKPQPVSPHHAPSPNHLPNHLPNHTHTVHRKSISPAPPSPSPRRHSGVPFGPDDYASLNPHAPAAAAAEPDPDAKIILHDGREVDPSDHLPEASWAALPPNLKKSFDDGPAPRESRPRPPPAGIQNQHQPQHSTGRRMERRERPQSSYISSESAGPIPPQGRARLQKKANRVSAAPAPMGGSSPLAPISPNPNTYMSQPGSWDGHRSLPRSQTGDWGAGDGYGAYTNGSPGGGYRGLQSGPPPVPGKVPLGEYGHGGGGSRGEGSGHGEPQENAWALLEEMKSIDLGSGRARRRKGGAIV